MEEMEERRKLGKYPLKDTRTEETRQNQLFDSIRKNVEKGMSEEQINNMKILGEKFHESFDVTKGTTHDIHEIQMEEALAYIVESLNSGIHPSYLNEDEKALVGAAFGEKYFEKWGFTSDTEI